MKLVPQSPVVPQSPLVPQYCRDAEVADFVAPDLPYLILQAEP